MWNRSLLYLAFFLYHLRSTVAGGSPPPYVPYEHILLACGSSENSNGIDGRFWIGDVNSSYFRPEHSQNQASIPATTIQYYPHGEAPYLYARISFHPFTYSFPVLKGDKFIRLYFAPTRYPGSTSSKALFSIKAGRFILLGNFTHPDFSVAKVTEYCVSVKENQMLNITVAPSANNSYAFISGIEILSMPPYLYYTSPDHEGLPFIGQQNLSRVDNQTALEMVYRVNVGGTSLLPTRDTGMFRSWSMDDQYLAKPQHGVSTNSFFELNFRKIPAYIAPREVYGTVRTRDPTSSLAWNFPVGSGFVYLVRLHFCAVFSGFGFAGEEVFDILIANQTAENYANVLSWAGGNNFPIYKDYVVHMFNTEDEEKINLSIELNGNLNGIEIFKTSNLEYSLAKSSRYPLSTKRKHNRTTIITTVGGGIFAFAVLLVLCFLKFQRRKSAKDSSSPIKSTQTPKSSPPSDLCPHFPLTKIKAATNNFDQAFIIGVGGFGNVYKGYIDRGADPIAIKRLAPGSQQGAHEFETEIKMLSQLRHRHLVSLIGYCDDDNEMILVYDYMARGTLRNYLCNTNHPPLPWEQRLKICTGAARGLNYLHTGTKHMIIHRDVKTTNILLDEKWVAKVSDFGLSKVGPSGTINAHVSTIAKGTFGYLDPEYFRCQQLTQKSDVYSFGIVLCEVLCTKPRIFHTEEMQAMSLANWVMECYHNDALDQIVDPLLSNKIVPECLTIFAEITVNCLHDNGTKRPCMNDVVRDLELALQLQKGVDQDLMLDEVGESNGICCSSNGQDFLELMSPKGR